MSKQVSMQLTEATQRQVRVLTARGFGNRTDIVRIAVDRMYREENKIHIRIEHSEAALWGTTDPNEEGYDERESLETFENILDGMLTEAYPDAEIEIVRSINDRVLFNGYIDHDEIPWINQIIEKAFNSDWVCGDDTLEPPSIV